MTIGVAMTEDEKRQHRNRLARQRNAVKRLARNIVHYELTEDQVNQALMLAMKLKLGVR